MNTEVMFSSKTDAWATPADFYHKAEIRFIRGRLKFGNSKKRRPVPFDGGYL